MLTLATSLILFGAPVDLPPPSPPSPVVSTCRPRPAWLTPLEVSHAVLQGLDYHSTRRALASGRGREANPVMRGVVGRPVVFGAVKAAGTLGIVAGLEAAACRYPRGSVLTAAALNGLMAVIVARNYRIGGGR